jgi:hypothetical protein
MTGMAKNPFMTTAREHLPSADATNNLLCFIVDDFSTKDNH